MQELSDVSQSHMTHATVSDRFYLEEISPFAYLGHMLTDHAFMVTDSAGSHCTRLTGVLMCGYIALLLHLTFVCPAFYLSWYMCPRMDQTVMPRLTLADRCCDFLK